MVFCRINYPNKKVTIHENADCTYLQPNYINPSRLLVINTDNKINMLNMFVDKKFRFRAEKGMNKLDIRVDLGDINIERGFITTLLKIIGEKYLPIKDSLPTPHC